MSRVRVGRSIERADSQTTHLTALRCPLLKTLRTDRFVGLAFDEYVYGIVFRGGAGKALVYLGPIRRGIDNDLRARGG
jgi:hypothetical protein